MDDEGVIRGRWEAWSPGVAGDVALAAWVLCDMPRNNVKVDIPTVRQLLQTGHADRALYILEQLPADTLRDHLRLMALLDYNLQLAGKAFDAFVTKYRQTKSLGKGIEIEDNSAEFISAMRDFRDSAIDAGTKTAVS